MTTNNTVALNVEEVTPPADAVAAASEPALFVCGPPMTAKFELLLALLAGGDDHVMVVTTKHPADDVIGTARSLGDWDEDRRFGVVDALSTSGGPAAERDGTFVRTVGSAGNLTRIGIEFSGLVDELAGPEDAVDVGLHSLSPLLMSSGLQPIYRFLGTLTGRIRHDDNRVIVVSDTPAGEHDVASLHHHFDAILETRLDDDGRRQLRVTGGRESPSDWLDY